MQIHTLSTTEVSDFNLIISSNFIFLFFGMVMNDKFEPKIKLDQPQHEHVYQFTAENVEKLWGFEISENLMSEKHNFAMTLVVFTLIMGQASYF